MRLIRGMLLMHIKQLLITVSRVFSCVNQTYIDPILLSHSYIATSRDLNTTRHRISLLRRHYLMREAQDGFKTGEGRSTCSSWSLWRLSMKNAIPPSVGEWRPLGILATALVVVP